MGRTLSVMGLDHTHGNVHGNGENDSAANLGDAPQDAASADAAPAAGTPTGGAGGANIKHGAAEDGRLAQSLTSRAAWVRAQSPKGKHVASTQCHGPMLSDGDRDDTHDSPRSSPRTSASRSPRSTDQRAPGLRGLSRNADGRRALQPPTSARAGGEAVASSGRVLQATTSPRQAQPDHLENSALRRAATRFTSQLTRRVLIGRPEGASGFAAVAHAAAADPSGLDGDGLALTRSPPQSFAADGNFQFTPSGSDTHTRVPVAPGNEQDIAAAMEAAIETMEDTARALCAKGMSAPDGAEGAPRRAEIMKRLRAMEESLLSYRRDAAALLTPDNASVSGLTDTLAETCLALDEAPSPAHVPAETPRPPCASSHDGNQDPEQPPAALALSEAQVHNIVQAALAARSAASSDTTTSASGAGSYHSAHQSRQDEADAAGSLADLSLSRTIGPGEEEASNEYEQDSFLVQDSNMLGPEEPTLGDGDTTGGDRTAGNRALHATAATGAPTPVRAAAVPQVQLPGNTPQGQHLLQDEYEKAYKQLRYYGIDHDAATHKAGNHVQASAGRFPDHDVSVQLEQRRLAGSAPAASPADHAAAAAAATKQPAGPAPEPHQLRAGGDGVFMHACAAERPEHGESAMQRRHELALAAEREREDRQALNLASAAAARATAIATARSELDRQLAIAAQAEENASQQLADSEFAQRAAAHAAAEQPAPPSSDSGGFHRPPVRRSTAAHIADNNSAATRHGAPTESMSGMTNTHSTGTSVRSLGHHGQRQAPHQHLHVPGGHPMQLQLAPIRGSGMGSRQRGAAGAPDDYGDDDDDDDYDQRRPI